MTDVAPPPAVYLVIPDPRKAPVMDYDRVLRVVLQMEQHRWEWAGGALAFQRRSWREDTKLDYALASDPFYAMTIARARLARFSVVAAEAGIPWTAIVAFESWRWGIEEALTRAKRSQHSSYARRAFNLYNDRDFK